MRALILVATAALAVSACSKNDAAENTANLDEMTTENVVVDNTMDANMTMNADANMDMNATANTDANADANATANNAM